MYFTTPVGLLLTRLRLEDSLATATPGFASWYKKQTQAVDVLMYHGHSYLGSSIDGLAKLAHFKRGKYQIYYLNGCGTFAYLGDELFRSHGAVNPSVPATLHLDVITNSLASYFARNASSALTMISALVEQKASYPEILLNLDARSRALVDGEQDNTWHP
jgi:hypothetical protein